jgi:chromosome segregation ATPase
MKIEETMKLTEQFAGKRRLEEKIDEIRVALGAYTTIDNLQLAAEGKRRYVNSLRKELSDESSNVRVYPGDIDLAEAEAREAETIFSDALAKKNQLTDELKTLETMRLATAGGICRFAFPPPRKSA